MNKLPFVSIITVNYNGKKFLKDCFDSLYQLDYPQEKLEIIMIDNCSGDDSVSFVRENYPKIIIIQNDINNYCKGNNLGIAKSQGEYIALLNNDTKVDKSWLRELVDSIESDSLIGAVGSKILLMDGSVESNGHQELPNFYWADKASLSNDVENNELIEVTSLCGCSVLYRKSALEKAGPFDEDFSMYLEDVDISIRLKRNKWKILHVPKSLVYHIHHGSSQEDLALFYTERNRLLLIAKHYPKKLSYALLGRGYFTVQRDIKAQAGLYTILADLVIKLIKHHGIAMAKEVLEELFIELKKISNYENYLLVEKMTGLLKKIEIQESLIQSKEKDLASLNLSLKKKEEYIVSLDYELKKREEAFASLNLETERQSKLLKNLRVDLTQKEQAINDIYNSTAFKFLVRPLWTVLWKIKEPFRRKKIAGFSSGKEETAQAPAGKIAICTIIAKNYLAHARVLAESFKKYNAGEVFVLLVDHIDGYFDPDKEKFSLIEIETLKDRVPDFNRFCFQYNTTELSTAIKPFFLEFLFEKYSLQKVIFFDPDILITHGLDEAFGLLDNYSILLTPHITRPYTDTAKPYELDILRSGVYNLGFLGLADRPSTRTLLVWWKKRLIRHCKIDFNGGLFVDQKWMDLIPGFFSDVYILREPTYNIAYWNLHYRQAQMNGEAILVDSKPVIFLHFSGLNIENIESISKHQDRFRLKDLSFLRPIFELYRDKLINSGYDIAKEWPCVFEYFNNQIKIPDIARKIFWTMSCNGHSKFTNPFDASAKKSFFYWLNGNIDDKEPKITRLMHEIYQERQDLQRAYPDIFGSDRKKFVERFALSAKQEYGFDDSFLKYLFRYGVKKRLFSSVSFITKITYHTRNILRDFCKKLFKNNPKIINRLKIMERNLVQKTDNLDALSKGYLYSKKPVGQMGVNVVGYITSELGIGEGGRANISSLKAVGVAVSIINITSHSSSRKEDTSFSDFSEHNPFGINLIEVNADMLPKLYIEKGRKFFQNKYNIGFWNWELSEFPDSLIKSFGLCEEIWVPSNFIQEAISKKSPVPVIKIPHAVSVTKFKPLDRKHFDLKDEEFVFLFVFDFFSYFERKNPLAIIEAFKLAFSSVEKVRLVIKCTNSSFDQTALTKLREASKDAKINIVDGYLFREEVNTLISLCDAYISLHRSEGFGLTMAEAMYLGKPVIATGYSGNCDFMNLNNSFLAKHKLVEIEEDVGPYKKGNLWAEPDIEHAAQLMSYVFENRGLAKEMGNRAAQDIRDRLSYKKVGSGIKSRLDYIYKISGY